MIVKGGSRSGAGYWGKHLDDTTRINESAEIVYAEGVEGDTPKDILKEYADMAKRSRVQKFLYHMIFNNKGDRHLTPAEEIKAYKAAAIKMGLEGQPFFIVRHKEANGISIFTQ